MYFNGHQGFLEAERISWQVPNFSQDLYDAWRTHLEDQDVPFPDQETAEAATLHALAARAINSSDPEELKVLSDSHTSEEIIAAQATTLSNQEVVKNHGRLLRLVGIYGAHQIQVGATSREMASMQGVGPNAIYQEQKRKQIVHLAMMLDSWSQPWLDLASRQLFGPSFPAPLHLI